MGFIQDLKNKLKEKGFEIRMVALERSLTRLCLAFYLKEAPQQAYSWRVPLFYDQMQSFDFNDYLLDEL